MWINHPQFQTAISDSSDPSTPQAEIDVLDRSNMSGHRGSKIVMILYYSEWREMRKAAGPTFIGAWQ